MSVNVDRFIEAARHWLQARANQVPFNWPVKGGWEGWVQVDLAAFMIARDPLVDVLREQYIYEEGGKVDLLFNANAGGVPLGVELKAESFENRLAGLMTEVRKDILKVEAGRGARFQATPVVLLVTTFNQESLNRLLAIERDGHAIFRTVFMNPEVAMVVAVHTPAVGWSPAHAPASSQNEMAMVIDSD